MTYATQADIESRYPGALKQTGPVSAGVIDAVAVALALFDASNLADGYLRRSPFAFIVPVPDPVPDWLVALVVDIGLYRATSTVHASLPVFEDRRKRYLDALMVLEAIADGTYNPDGRVLRTALTGPIPMSITHRPRLFGRGAL